MSLDQYIKDMAKRAVAGQTNKSEATPARTSSLDQFISNIARRGVYKNIGFETLGDDLNRVVSNTQGYIEGGWADGNATAAQKQSVSSMISRLKSAKQYYTNHPEQFSGDVSKSIEEIDRTLGSLTELSGYIDKAGEVYSKFENADEYNAAKQYSEIDEYFKDFSSQDMSEVMLAIFSNAQAGNQGLVEGITQSGKKFSFPMAQAESYGSYLNSARGEREIGEYVAWAKQQGDFDSKSYAGGALKHDTKDNGTVDISARVNGTADYSTAADRGQAYIGYYDKLISASVNADDAKFYPMMTAEEVKTFNYIRNTQGDEAAKKYHDAIYPVLGQRYKEQLFTDKTAFAKEHPWLATAQSVIENTLLAPITMLSNGFDLAGGNGYNLDSAVNIMGSANDLVYATVPEVWAKKYGWDEGEKGFYTFMYNTGVSVAQTVAASVIYGGYWGGPIGASASLFALGAQSAHSTMRNLAAQGAEDWQIYLLGTVAGATEVIMEKVPLDKLLKIGKEGGKAGLKATLKNILGQAWTEMKEEAATEIVNILADSIVRLDESELAKAVNEKGLLAALKDSIGQVIMAGASGAVSGGFMGSVFSIYGGTVGSAQYRPVGKFIVDNGAANTLIEQGLKLGQGSEAYEIAELLKRRMTNNREGKLNATSYADVGRLYALETAAVREQYMQATENKLSVKLEAAGVKSSKAEGLAAALAKAISGEQMTRAETRAIGKSAQAMQILEQSRAMLDPARVAFNPIQKSTTYGIADGTMVITRLGNSNMYRVDLLPSANAERVASTGEIGDGAVRTLESQSVRQVEQMVKKAAEGAGIADISSGFGEQLSSDEAAAMTMISAVRSGVNENVAGIAAGIAEAMGGDLRIVFDPELSKTGDTGIYRKNYDGTREAQIAPTLGGMVSTLAHELFHDIEDTAAGKAFIAAAVEYAKTLPAKNPDNGANRYEEVKHLYQTRKGVNDKTELETEVGAKIAGDILASEDALMAVLEHMKPQQKASLWQRLKRALTSLRDKLKGQKNAKPAETQLNVLERLYKQAFAQRVIQDAVENPRVGGPNAVSEQKGKKTPTEGESSANDRQVTGKLNSDQKEKAPEREADVAAQNAQKAVFGSEKVEDDTSGSFGVKACLSEADGIGQKSIAYNERHGKVNAAVLKVGVEVMMEMAETMKPYLEEEGILPPDTNRNNGKTLFKNGSYGRTAENTTKCIRTLTYDDFKDRVAEEIGRPLTVAESLLVSQKIYDIATDPQCIYCYVAADRKAYDEYLGEYHAAMDKYIKALKDGGDSDELYQEYIEHKPKNDTKARRRRWEAWKKLAKSGGKYITAADLATSAKRNAIIDQGGALAEQVKDAQRYAQSASWAKKVEEYRAYNGEILRLTQQLVDTLNSEYGLRMYSFSDYTPAFIVENMQMIIDAACRGLKSLAYTKDTDYAKIFARTGQAINISCFAKWQDGVYVEDNRQGADWAESKKLREQYPNVGIVMVAVTEPMVEWAVRQDWIDVVIPYHIVKTGTKIANEYQWRNFTADSADKAGNRVANIYPTEHNNDFATYKRLIEERGLTPRFNEYYERVARGELTPDQYMKLVNEVRLPASELSAVVPDFDLDAARESFGVDAEGNVIEGGFVDKGGYMGSWYREGVDVEQEAMQVADDIRAGKSSLDVEYGMNSRAKLRQAQKYGVIKADVAEGDISDGRFMDAEERAKANDAAKSKYNEGKINKWSAQDVQLLKLKAEMARNKKVFDSSELDDAVSRSLRILTPTLVTHIAGEGRELTNIRTTTAAKKLVAKALTNAFNSKTTETERRDLCRACADYLIRNTLADDMFYAEQLTETQAMASAALDVLQKYRGRIDIDFETAEAHRKGKGIKKKIAKTWLSDAPAKGVSVFEVANALAERGVTLDIDSEVWTEAEVLEIIDKLYSASLDAMAENVTTSIGSPQDYSLFIGTIADELYDTYDVGGKNSTVTSLENDKKLEIAALQAEQDSEREKFKDKVKEIREKEYEKRKEYGAQVREKKRDEIAAIKAEQESTLDKIALNIDIGRLVMRVKDMQKRKKLIGALGTEEWDAVMKTAGKITPGRYVSGAAVTDFAEVFMRFLEVHAPKLLDYGKAGVAVRNDSSDAKSAASLHDRLADINKLREKAEATALPEDEEAKAITEDLEMYRLMDEDAAIDVVQLANRAEWNVEPQIQKDIERRSNLIAKKEQRGLTQKEIEEISEAARERARKRELNQTELEALRNILRAVMKINSRYNQILIDDRWQDTDKYASEGIGQSDSYYGLKKQNPMSKLVDKQMKGMTPTGVFEALGGFVEDSVIVKCFDAIKKAENARTRKRMEYLKEAENFYTDEKHKKWQKHFNDDRITLQEATYDENGKVIDEAVKITVGEAMALYCTSKREHAKLGLALAKITFNGHNKRGKDVANNREFRLLDVSEDIGEAEYLDLVDKNFIKIKEMIDNIYKNKLTDEDREFIEIVENFFRLSGKEKSAQDRMLTGTTNVIGSYYFPIIRSVYSRDINIIGNDREFGSFVGVQNLPFNQNTVKNAKAPVYIMDIWDLIQKYAGDLASYVTLTVPLQNLNRIYNCRVEINGEETTMREYYEKHVWSKTSGYIRDLMHQVQGKVEGTAMDRDAHKWINRMKSNHAIYALGFNFGSYLKQKTTEFAILSSDDITVSSWLKGMMWRPRAVDRDGAKKKWYDYQDVAGKLAQMRKYSDAAYIRQDSTELLRAAGAYAKIGRIGQKTMKLVGHGDDIATLRIMSVAQYATQQKSGYGTGTIENVMLAGDLVNKLIDEYQDTSAIATKSAYMRSGNPIVSGFTIFTSSVAKQYTRLCIKAGRWDSLKLREKNGSVKPGKDAVRKARRAFWKEYSVFLIVQVTLTALLSKLWRKLQGKDEPEDKVKGYIEDLFNFEFDPVLDTIYDTLAEQLTIIPLVGSVWENIRGGYETTGYIYDMVNTGIDTVGAMGDLFLNVVDGKEIHWGSRLNSIFDGLGMLNGIPTRNMRNIMNACVNVYSMISGDTSLKYTVDSWQYKPNYVDDLNAAIDAGDERLAETVADMLMVDRVGSSVGSEAAGEIVSLYASGETGVLPSKIGNKITVSINDESREIELTAAEQRELRTEYGKATGAVRRMVSTSAYSRLTTSERAVAVRDMNRLYMDRAKAKLHGADMTTAVAMTYLMSEGKYICAYAHIKAIKADKTVKNKATQIKRWLRSQGLSVAEQRAILYASGYRSEENLAAVKRLLRSASLSAKEKAAVRAALSIE